MASADTIGTAGASVLVVDDEPQIRKFVTAGLEFRGYKVKEAKSGAAGLSAAVQMRPDVIVLDLGLPDMTGAEVLESLRSWSTVPIIVLSIDSDEEQKVVLLKLGADDYIVKPFGIAELAARCEAALRRYQKSTDKNPIVRTGPLVVDFDSRSVMLGEERITLTRKEYRLLRALPLHLGLVLTHQQLIKEICERPQGDHVVQQARSNKDQDPGNERNDWRDMGGSEMHDDLRWE
jgi:two-component system, OmpR family, KDP operon response regulator KdpE